MKTALAYIDELKGAKGWESDYRVAKELRWSPSKMGNYRTGYSIPDVDACTQVAEALGIDPLVVISAAEAERAGRARNMEAVARWRLRWERAVAACFVAAIGIVEAGREMVCILCEIEGTGRRVQAAV